MTECEYTTDKIIKLAYKTAKHVVEFFLVEAYRNDGGYYYHIHDEGDGHFCGYHQNKLKCPYSFLLMSAPITLESTQDVKILATAFLESYANLKQVNFGYSRLGYPTSEEVLEAHHLILV